jgi:hypothetical protein
MHVACHDEGRFAFATATTRTFMIDPRRKQQNDQRAAKLLEFQRELSLRGGDDLETWIEALGPLIAGMAKNWEVPNALQTDFVASREAFAVAGVLVESSLGPLRDAIVDDIATDGPLEFTFNGRAYELGGPRPHSRHPGALFAPLTSHVCSDLVRAVSELHVVVFDPGENKPLGVEQAHYARERTKLIWIEDWLWNRAAEFGGLTDRIPYASRLLLLAMAWHPIAHKPPGAWTLCVRCGVLLHRKRSMFHSLPRCSACMKETTKQRKWPAHASAPHGRATWLLNCQYPGCEMVYEGTRHRKYCPDHTSSRLTPSRRPQGTKKGRASGPARKAKTGTGS